MIPKSMSLIGICVQPAIDMFHRSLKAGPATLKTGLRI
jgi:hypothetical protein